MPSPASGIFTNAVGNIASSFFSTGLVVLSAIGPALLGVAALFVLFYLVAMSFGWRLKMPVRPGTKKGVLGNPKKVHFERGSAFSFRAAFNGAYSKFWTLQTPVSPTVFSFLRPSHAGGGISKGHASFGGGDFVDGFGVDVLPFGDGDGPDDEWGGDWLDRDDVHDGFYSDPSDDAPWTSDSGPDSAPGRQEGGASPLADREIFRNSLGDSVCGGLNYGSNWFGSDVSNAMPLRLSASCFTDSSPYEMPSWDFLNTPMLGDSERSSPFVVMRTTEKAWADMFGWNLALAPNEHCAYSAETTYHALRIMELARMRDMGFQGSYDEFWTGLDRVSGSGDVSDYGFQSDPSGDEDFTAYDH
jgi:hypothetical protein